MTNIPALVELLEKATPGPWLAFDNRDLNGAWWIGRERFVTHAECRAGSDDAPDCAEHDAALIVAMRNALPALLAERASMEERIGEIEEAGRAIIDRMSSTYKARNGREMGIQGDDGEKCWIVHSDEISVLEALLADGETR